jgi:hypothetical protein
MPITTPNGRERLTYLRNLLTHQAPPAAILIVVNIPVPDSQEERNTPRRIRIQRNNNNNNKINNAKEIAKEAWERLPSGSRTGRSPKRKPMNEAR